jgi:hypothetical protein
MMMLFSCFVKHILLKQVISWKSKMALWFHKIAKHILWYFSQNCLVKNPTLEKKIIINKVIKLKYQLYTGLSGHLTSFILSGKEGSLCRGHQHSSWIALMIIHPQNDLAKSWLARYVHPTFCLLWPLTTVTFWPFKHFTTATFHLFNVSLPRHFVSVTFYYCITLSL